MFLSEFNSQSLHCPEIKRHLDSMVEAQEIILFTKQILDKIIIPSQTGKASIIHHTEELSSIIF